MHMETTFLARSSQVTFQPFRFLVALALVAFIMSSVHPLRAHADSVGMNEEVTPARAAALKDLFQLAVVPSEVHPGLLRVTLSGQLNKRVNVAVHLSFGRPSQPRLRSVVAVKEQDQPNAGEAGEPIQSWHAEFEADAETAQNCQLTLFYTGLKVFPEGKEYEIPIKHFVPVAGKPKPSADQALLLEYRWSGGRSPLTSAAVSVFVDGQVVVKFEKQAEKLVTCKFALDSDELSALKATTRAARAAVHPEDGGTSFPDRGDSTLTVAVGATFRTLRNPSGDTIELLIQSVWRLVNQGVLTHGLETHGDVYPVSVATSATSAGAKVYAPRLLAGPLKAFVATCTDKQKLEWGLTSLAWLVTEEQWLGFVSNQIETANAARKPLLLSALAGHPFYANIPPRHADALLPILAVELDVSEKLEDADDEALATVCRFLGSRKYREATPLLTRFAKAHAGTSAGNAAVWAINAIKAEGN